VTKDEHNLRVIPASKVEQVVIFGNVNITTSVIHYLLREGKDCVFCSSTGRYHGRLFSTESRFGLLRRSQLEAVTDKKLQLTTATQFIRGKLANQITFLQRYQRSRWDSGLGDIIGNLQSNLDKVSRTNDIGSLLGLEGYSSSVYFSTFKNLLKQELGFTVRVKRPPKDPVNSLLSLGYTLLVYDMQAAIRIVGLDPFLGFLHSTEYSKPSLALDLIEEFRTVIIDSIVLRLINSMVLKKEDFSSEADAKGMVRLNQKALKLFIECYERRVTTEIIHPVFSIKATYRRCLELQARQISRLIMGRQDTYRPFLVK